MHWRGGKKVESRGEGSVTEKRAFPRRKELGKGKKVSAFVTSSRGRVRTK